MLQAAHLLQEVPEWLCLLADVAVGHAMEDNEIQSMILFDAVCRRGATGGSTCCEELSLN